MVPLHSGLQGSQQEILFPGRSEELCIFFRTFKTCKTNTKTNSLTSLYLSIWCVCHTHMHTHYTPVCVGMHLRWYIGKGKVNGHLAGLAFLPPPWGSWDCLGCQTWWQSASTCWVISLASFLVLMYPICHPPASVSWGLVLHIQLSGFFSSSFSFYILVTCLIAYLFVFILLASVCSLE